jgi:UDP-N-acetyl-D-galactosamine dehydrogenase
VVDVYQELKSFGMEVDVYDPLANPAQALREYGIALIQDIELSAYQAILLAVPHQAFSDLAIQSSQNCVVYDLKGVLPRKKVDKRL